MLILVVMHLVHMRNLDDTSARPSEYLELKHAKKFCQKTRTFFGGMCTFRSMTMLSTLAEKAESALHFGRLDCRTVWVYMRWVN